MYRKNVAGQFLCVQLLLTATGAPATGLAPAMRRCIDGTFAAGGGTFTEDGTTGSYKYAMSQADTNGNDISFIVTATGAIPVCVNIVTTAGDPTDAAAFGLTRLDAAVTTRASQTSLDTVDDFIDTEVAAIKAKTDNLPASPAATGDAMTLTASERNSVADALLNRDMSVGTDSGSPTVRTVRQALRFLRNKWSIAAGTLTVTKEDDATASWTSAVTGTAGADPITSSDPA